jgi:phospholipid/cholesterol/gamma-HCH transport system permease protein
MFNSGHASDPSRPPASMSVEVRRTDEGLELELTGEWVTQRLALIQTGLAAVDVAAARQVSIATQQLTALDLSGAWALREFLRRARAAGAVVTFRGTPPDQLRLLDEILKEGGTTGVPEADAVPEAERALEAIGRQAVRAGQDLMQGLAFVGRTSTTFVAGLVRPRRLRPIAIARHVYDTGITAMPIVALIAFLISVIIAYMSARQLRGLGADIYVVDLVTIGVLRELGVLLTSIIVAGRSGSAYAAELGSMQLNEEVDALTATGVDPFELLVVPRVVGLTIALPLLTIIADLIGLTGGALLCRYLLDMPLSQYANRVIEAISPTTFWVGVIKAPVFAVLIALAGCYRGMQVHGSARELGRLVTVAVVQAIFFVILADALFAVLFMEMDI